MDAPQHANAAQMAARKIKQLKPRAGAKRHGTPGRAGSAELQSFTPMPSQNCSNIFGGNVPQASTFNFSAPGGASISFPPPNVFGNNNRPEASPEPSDGRFAGDDRATKRPFGGSSTTQQSNPPFPNQGGFNLNQQTNPFGANQQQANSLFGAAPPSNPFGFNSTPSTAPTTSQPGSIFSFGGASQPTTAAPSISFGSTPSESKPVSNLFGSVAPEAKPAASPFSFSQPAQPAPSTLFNAPAPQQSFSSSSFNFGQMASGGAPAVSSVSFGSTPATTAPKLFFGQAPSSQPPPSTTLGTATSQQPPSSNLFGHLSSAAPSTTENAAKPPQSPKPATMNLFGGLNQGKPAATSNMFGSQAQEKPAPTNTLFGQSQPAPAPASSLFSQSKQTPAPGSSLFGEPNAAKTTSSLFAPANAPTPSSSNIFAGFNSQKAPEASKSLFGNPTAQKSEATPATNNMFGAVDAKKSETITSSNSLFGGVNTQTSTSSLFSNLNKPVETPKFLFGGGPVQPPQTNGLFGGESKENEPAKDLFSALNKPVAESVMKPKSSTNFFPASESKAAANGSSSMPNGPNGDSSNLFSQSQPMFSQPPPQQSPSKKSTGFSFSSTQPPSQPASNNIENSPLKAIEAPPAASQPPPKGMFPTLPKPTEPQQQVAEVTGRPINPYAPAADDHSMTGQKFASIMQITEESIANQIPAEYDAKMRCEFLAAYRLRALNLRMEQLFKEIHVYVDPAVALKFYQEERKIIISILHSSLESLGISNGIEDRENQAPKLLTSGAASATASPSKRRINSEDQENENPSKRTKQQEVPRSNNINGRAGSTGLTPSAPTRALSPTKSSQSGNIFQQNSAPKPSQQQIFTAPSPAPASAPTPSPTKGKKRMAEDHLDQNTVQTGELRKIKAVKSSGGFSGANTPEKTSTTSSIFRNILESPAKTPAKAKEDTPRVNPFANLPGTPAAKKAELPPPASFVPKPTVASVNPFVTKPSTENSSSKASASAAGGFTPNLGGFTPKIGANPLSAMDQFKAKVAEQEAKEDREKALEEYDSDDDGPDKKGFVAKFIAKRKAEREAAKKEKEASLKNGPTSAFTPGQGFVFVSKAAESGKEEPKAAKSLFAEIPSQSFGYSAQSSLNGSRASTPGILGSSTGSVLDGHATSKPTDFSNIFGHLSDSSKPKDEADDEDDEQDEEEETDAEGDTENIEGDSENIDPTYRPGTDSGSGPGTPVEETGPGIASAKKTNLFSFSASASGTSTPAGSLFNLDKSNDKGTSGTSTPGRSLFERIPTDQNGRPLRVVSTEEKENTQPSTANVFGDSTSPFSSLNKSGPTDQTWKPDSPIKFGASTTNGEKDAPVVNVTAATPTKGSPSGLFSSLNSGTTTPSFGNLFGNKTDSKPAPPTSNPFSSLFGNSAATKPSSSTNVGFAFGGSSTPSSLFPSAAGSASTSRATSPGNTTDGESTAEGDPDAEKHEQVNLTSGGAGEEDEEAIHEVRAKALKFDTNSESSNPWATKGLGPLRILKHRETGVSRILMRADPSGSIVLNKGILGSVKYEPKGKTVPLTTTSHDGGLETWILQVKTAEFAEKLAKVLEENKSVSS